MNYQLADALNDLSGHYWLLDQTMDFCAKYLIFVAGVIFALVMFPVLRRRDWWRLGSVGLSLVLAFGLGIVAANLYAEPRPFTTHPDILRLISHAAGQSFPSDHATAAFAIAVALLAFVSVGWGSLLFVVALVIGVARVYTGVHYPGDILGSLVIALVAVGAVYAAGVLAQHPVRPLVPQS